MLVSVRSLLIGFWIWTLCFAVSSQTTMTAVEALSQYRIAMGLGAVAANDTLAKTAKAHSSYLSALSDRSILSKLAPDGTPEAHLERLGNAHFTGVTLGDRTKRQGYRFGAGEQVLFSSIKPTAITGAYVVNQLMATVYHRSGLLNPAWTELGEAALTANSVLVMGEGAVKGQAPPAWIGTFPASNSTVSRVAFKNEIPDPAPDRPGQWLGLPISIHALAGRTLKVFRFELRERSAASASTDTLVGGKILNAASDKLIGKNEVFFLPTNPLHYARTYDVWADIGLGATARSLHWSFQTPSNPFNVVPTAEVIEITPGTAQTLELRGIQGNFSWVKQTSSPEQAPLSIVNAGEGRLIINFPTACNANCKAVVTIKHDGPHPSSEQRVFVVAKAWLATRSLDELLPKSFADAAKQMSKQQGFKAMAYGSVGGQWFMGSSTGGISQDAANIAALAGCAKQATQLKSSQPCSLYPFK
jgi:Cysteine-rich secretory protein family